MPKKQPKNAFYFYMLDFKEEQKRKGINYGNMAEVADAAGPLWRDAPQPVRAKFEALAKREKERANVPTQKFTSTGQSLAEIERQEKELKEAEDTERRDIKNMVKLKSFNKAILWEDFYLIDVNYFCKTGGQYLIGEFAVLRFNLRDGIKEHYHENINPGIIPTGYAFDVKLGSQEYGLEMPDEEPEKRSNYIQILAYIIDYLKQKNREDKPEALSDSNKDLPPMFTMPDKIEPVLDFIKQMCFRASEDYDIFRVYRLDLLLFHLANAFATARDEGLPKESLAMVHLKQDTFKYTPGIGCDHHEAVDKSVECSKSRVTRWAYSMMDRALLGTGIEPVPGRHVPFDFHMEGILQYKETRNVRAGPSVASSSSAAAVTCPSSTGEESLNESGTTTSASIATRVQRTHTPLRKPNIDYSKVIRPPPEITESPFQPIISSRGRGSGMGGSGRNMNTK